MPTKPATPCAHGPCPETTHTRYCEDHETRQKLYPTRRYPDNRPSAAQRGYDRTWRKARRRYLRRHPLCEHCAEAGEDVPAALVDHIEPLPEGDRLKTDNLQALCRPCHDKKTRLDARE